MTKTEKAERAEAISKLREWIKPGDTVYTILRHVSKSGMRREVGVVLLSPAEGREVRRASVVDLHPNYLVAQAIGSKVGKNDGIIMDGCGTDMGFEVVYNLGRVLWPDGVPCAGERCHSNDHSNGMRERGDRIMHSDGGYALAHRWL